MSSGRLNQCATGWRWLSTESAGNGEKQRRLTGLGRKNRQFLANKSPYLRNVKVVQGHQRSIILVPIESTYTTSYLYKRCGVQWSVRSVDEPRMTCVTDALSLCGTYTFCAVKKVIQGWWFWYQLKARMRLPISCSLWLWSYLAPFLRYGDLLAKNCLFFWPLSHSAPSLPMFSLEFRIEVNHQETKSHGLSSSEDSMIVALVMLTQCQHDRRTDRRI